MQFRHDIQGLRALAFLLVFLFHLNSSWLPGGFLGVDLFFVISGYLITTITLSDIDRAKFSFIHFFIKRIKRIVPTYLALLVGVAVAGSFIFLATDISTLQGTILRSFLFISNQLFAQGNSYFGAQLSENPLLHTWSLAIEMQFYVLLPFILWFFRNKLRYVLPILIVGTTVYSTYHLYVLGNKSAMYFSLIARVPEFLVGAYAAVLFKEGINFRRNFNNLLSIGSLAVLLCCAFWINEDTNFPGYLALLPCTASALLLVIKNNAVSAFFSHKIPVYIGEMSYSLYLWHWPVLAFMRYRNDTYQLNIQEMVFAAVCTFILSWVSYTFIEKNFKRISLQKVAIILFSSGIILAISYFTMPTISEQNRMSDRLTQPIFGLASHNSDKIEKFGNEITNDSIILIGDSHALMLKPFLNKIGVENNFSFYTLTTDSFPPIPGISRSEVNNESLQYFNDARKYIPKTDSLIKANKIIILNICRADKLFSIPTAISGLARKLRPNQKLILIGTFPTLNFNPIKVKTSVLRKIGSIQVKFHPESRAVLRKIASENSNTYYYDISKSDVYKTAPYINDTVAYYNADHINNYGSLKLAEDIGKDFYQFLQDVSTDKK